MFAEHTSVILIKPLTGSGLNIGDIGIVVQVYDDGTAYKVEFGSMDDELLKVVSVAADQIRAATPEEINKVVAVPAKLDHLVESCAPSLIPAGRLSAKDDSGSKKMPELTLDRYKELDEKLRHWMILYGVGVATLFVTQSALMREVSITKECALWIIGLSLGPAFLQLLLLLSLKYTMLVLYRGCSPEENSIDPKSLLFKSADKWASWFWPDILVDLLSAVSYFVATLLLVVALSKNIGGSTSQVDKFPNAETFNGNQEKEGGEEESSAQKSSEEEGQKEGRKEKSEEEGRQKEREEGVGSTALLGSE